MAEPYVNPAELPVKRRENIALGVLGALLFSAAGGLVHFGLLQLGYIAWISALVGWLTSSTFGLRLNSRAMITFCALPPEREPTAGSFVLRRTSYSSTRRSRFSLLQ